MNLSILQEYTGGILYLINIRLVPILIAVAFITFLWGIYKYFILGAANDTERETGRQFVLWGIIGFVTIFSIWGLVALITATFGPALAPGGGAPPYPKL